MAYRVTLIPATAPARSWSTATRRVLEATGVSFDVGCAGGRRGRDGKVWHAAARARAGVHPAQQGGAEGPHHHAHRQRLSQRQRGPRKALDLYANVRPAQTMPGVRARYEDVDLVIFRENTEGSTRASSTT